MVDDDRPYPARTERLPRHLDDVTSAWLSELLANRHPGVRIESMEVVEVKNTHTTKVRVALERNGVAIDAGIPRTVCLKANWAEASTGDICEREARFYDLIAHDTCAWAPTSFYADWDPGTGRGVVVLEDLVAAPGEFGTSSDDIGIDGVAAGLESLAAVHAALWGDPRLDAPWMAASMGHSVDTEQVIQLWNYIEFNLTDPAYEAVLPGWVYERPELLNHVLDELTALELSQGGPQCLVHGDAHQGNSFLRADGTRIWLDWQLVRRGQPWRDVSYFMVGALDVEDRRDNDRALFRHYHECLTAGVGDGVASIDKAWDQFVRWPGYGMQAWLGNINLWGQDSGVEMVRRFFAAAEDYDTVALLTEGRRPRRTIAIGEGAWPLTPTLRSAIEARTSHAGNRVAMAATVPGERMSTTEGEELPADHGVGAFTERAPWVVAPETMSWRVGIADLRRDAAARVPGLVERRRIPPARGATVSWRLARTGIVWYARHRRQLRSAAAKADLAARLRHDFEQLGTTFIKLGQLVGSSDGMLAAEFVQEFKLCRDRVPPETFPHVRSVIEEDFDRPLESIFSSFDPDPIAAASIAQVHAATLLDGTQVVVKVQRPRIDLVVPEDIATMMWIAPLASARAPEASLANLPAYVELFAETIVEELDFRLEAENMLDIAAVLAKTDQRSVVVPRPHPDLVSRRVLVMERVLGFRTDDEVALAENGVDPTPVFRALMISFFEGAMIHGVFHGDLHGGNMMVTPGGRPAIFDFGITGRFSEAKRRAVLGLMLAAASQDARAMLRHFRDLGGFPEGADIDQIADEIHIEELIKMNASEVSPDDMALMMRETMHRLVQHGAKLPKQLFLYLKGMVYLNGAIVTLASDLDVFAEMAHIYEVMLSEHGQEIATLVDVETMPGRADIVQLMRSQTGAESDSATLAEMQEANARRQAEIRAAMKRLR